MKVRGRRPDLQVEREKRTVTVRMPRELHAKLATIAASQNLAMNSVIINMLMNAKTD
jgi:predicted HicB family RNase H-like nuclease